MLTSKQRVFLKAKAHALKPVLQIGKKGISESLLKEAQAALLAHELIKAKFSEYEDLQAEAQQLADGAEAELVTVTGKVAILYAPHPENPKLRLPKPPKNKDD
ncbi:MAG: YhbY family RNA-binding protein [Deltaproteobacteria bacterium]|nr:YhbY family RNA-binding protein [Deltaproteobacteria bacterium]